MLQNHTTRDAIAFMLFLFGVLLLLSSCGDDTTIQHNQELTHVVVNPTITPNCKWVRKPLKKVKHTKSQPSVFDLVCE